MRTFVISTLVVAMSLYGSARAERHGTILDATHQPASNFLAYTEFELSGEPLAESLGLDLDVLDPNALNLPTRFDYAAGIESYEYSEEAMYALNYQSQMGPHLVNGPINRARGEGLKGLQKRYAELALSVGFPVKDIPQNLYPISLPYQAGIPRLNLGKINASEGEIIDVINDQGEAYQQSTLVNAYQSDYQPLSWDRNSFSRVINPAALGGILLKEVMWSQDFLGGMHETASDEEVSAESSSMDQDGKHRLGVSAADGFQGMLLTEISLDKMAILQQQLGYNGKQLGVSITPAYDPTKQPVWFPHQVAIEEISRNRVNALGALKVVDGRSTLRDTWMLLWPTSEFFAFTDQREANTTQNPAFLAVFDGAPFAATPMANRDTDVTNNVSGQDGFSLTANLNNMLFQNLNTLHFNAKAGTLVDEYLPGKKGERVTTFDASYAMVALSIFQRAQDALPVGYASADGGAVNLKTAVGQRALELISAQADFLLKNAIGTNGLVFDELELGKKATGKQSLASQFAAIRGLIAAGLSVNNDQYLVAAKDIFLAIEKQLFDPTLGTWSEQPGEVAVYTPWTAAATSGALREIMLHLANQEGEHEPALELSHLADRYVSWFKITVNGGLQLAEPDGNTGENRLTDSRVIDSDGDGVKSIIGAGYAPVLANKVRLQVQ